VPGFMKYTVRGRVVLAVRLFAVVTVTVAE
jgi:hypothetical protein